MDADKSFVEACWTGYPGAPGYRLSRRAGTTGYPGAPGLPATGILAGFGLPLGPPSGRRASWVLPGRTRPKTLRGVRGRYDFVALILTLFQKIAIQPEASGWFREPAIAPCTGLHRA